MAKQTQNILQCCGKWVKADESTVLTTEPDGSWSLSTLECSVCGALYEINAMPQEAIDSQAEEVLAEAEADPDMPPETLEM